MRRSGVALSECGWPSTSSACEPADREAAVGDREFLLTERLQAADVARQHRESSQQLQRDRAPHERG
eukprot:5462448-Pyramimonas_sp.AAC.1